MMIKARIEVNALNPKEFKYLSYPEMEKVFPLLDTCDSFIKESVAEKIGSLPRVTLDDGTLIGYMTTFILPFETKDSDIISSDNVIIRRVTE